ERREQQRHVESPQFRRFDLIAPLCRDVDDRRVDRGYRAEQLLEMLTSTSHIRPTAARVHPSRTRRVDERVPACGFRDRTLDRFGHCGTHRADEWSQLRNDLALLPHC